MLTGAPQRRSWSPEALHLSIGLSLSRIDRALDRLERPRMGLVRVRLGNQTFNARPISKNDDGSWLMESAEYTGRTSPGTKINVQPNEVVSGALSAGTPLPESVTLVGPEEPIAGTVQPGSGLAAIEAAMAAERETLPKPADILAAHRADVAKQAAQPSGGQGAVPPGPTPAPLAAPNPGKPMTHLADKMKLLATGTSDFAASLEKMVDEKLAQHQATQATIMTGINDAFAKTDAIAADAAAGLAAIQATLKDLTNA